MSDETPGSMMGAALRTAGASFVATRLVVALGAARGAHDLVAANPETYHKGPFTEAALMWDAAWYVSIVREGYHVAANGGASNVAFPPLLPLLTWALGAGAQQAGFRFGDPDYGLWALAGVVISNLAFILALVVLWQLVALDHPARVADLTVWFVAAFPLGVFWSAFYTESLFLLLATSCVLAARRGLWPLAGALAGVSVLTRWAGIVLAGVLLVEWIAARWGPALQLRGARPAWWTLSSLGLVPLPLAGYAYWLTQQFGSAGVVVQSQQGWKHGLSFFPLTYAQEVGWLWQSVTRTGPDQDRVLYWGNGDSLYMWLNLGLPLLFALLGLWGWRRGWLRPGDGAWLALGLIFPLSLGTTLSLARYIMPLWPALIVAARLCAPRPHLERAWLVGSAALLLLGAYIYASAHWLG